VRVIVDGKVASSSTTDLRPDQIEAFLVRVIDMAQISEEDPFALPPDPGELAKTVPRLELFDPTTSTIDGDRALELALRAEKAAFAHDARITSSEGASFSRSVGHSVLCTSGGFTGRAAGTSQYIVAQVIADDEGGKKRNGYHYTSSRFFAELLEPEEIGREAAVRAVAQLGSSKMATGHFPVVFENEAAAGIVSLVASCVLGGAVYREQSYLGRRLGTRVASDIVDIVDDPLLARGPGSRGFDGEGRPVRRNSVIERGELRTFLLDSRSARKLKLDPTGSGGGGGGVPHATTTNFYMLPGSLRREQLLEGIDVGLYVTGMMGFGFDSVTGDFSRGAHGFMIEGGKLGRPVGEITISRNLDELLGDIDAIADDLEHRNSIASPSFRVRKMTVSGV
jgi:PmbA protein